jgi:lysozyme
MSRVSEEGLALVRHFEGFASRAYTCPAGHLTIGYGHLVQPDEPLAIDHVTAEYYLRHDMRTAEEAVARLLPVALTPYQFDALASFAFNLGSGALQRSALRRRVMAGAFDEAAEQFGRWVYGGGRKLPGLIRRRRAEALLFSGLNWRAAL